MGVQLALLYQAADMRYWHSVVPKTPVPLVEVAVQPFGYGTSVQGVHPVVQVTVALGVQVSVAVGVPQTGWHSLAGPT